MIRIMIPKIKKKTDADPHVIPISFSCEIVFFMVLLIDMYVSTYDGGIYQIFDMHCLFIEK